MSTTVKHSKMARRYGDDFKRQAVELVIHRGKSQRQVARELDVSEYSLTLWKKVYWGQQAPAEIKGEMKSPEEMAALIRQQQLVARKKGAFRPKTTVAAARAEPNRIANLVPERPDQIWVSDITYVATAEGWLYLAVILESFQSPSDRLEARRSARSQSCAPGAAKRPGAASAPSWSILPLRSRLPVHQSTGTQTFGGHPGDPV